MTRTRSIILRDAESREFHSEGRVTVVRAIKPQPDKVTESEDSWEPASGKGGLISTHEFVGARRSRWFIFNDNVINGRIGYARQRWPRGMPKRPTRKHLAKYGRTYRGYYGTEDAKWSESELVSICPWGRVGSVLVVRESYILDPPQDGSWDYYAYTDGVLENRDEIPKRFRKPKHVIYRSSWTGSNLRWRSAATMPAWAVRSHARLASLAVEQREVSCWVGVFERGE